MLRQQSNLPKKSSNIKKSPITWKSLAISSIVGAGLVLYVHYLREEKDKTMAKERRRQLGKAKIGGKFELVNTEGKIVRSDDFLGQWVLLYFGFTHCPDVCPDEIEKMTNVVNILGELDSNCLLIIIKKYLLSFFIWQSYFYFCRERT